MAFTPNFRKYLVIFLILGWMITLTYKYYFNKPLNSQRQIFRSTRMLMGTFWEVQSPDKKASEIVFNEVQRLELLLSKYQATSEISLLNRIGKLKVSPETFYIIKKSKEFWQTTDGAFDITVAPLIELWGFSSHQAKLPDNEEVKSVLKLIGSDKIILQENNSVVEFKLSGMKIDLGAIAKGFAIDCAIKKLKENKIKSCLINAGGQIYALGEKFSSSWKIAIKDPRQPGNLETLTLKDQSSSTSGDYQQYFQINNKRYCHIINPKTGYPVNSRINSVTVINKSGLNADALSTTIFILGTKEIKRLLIEFPDTKIYIKELDQEIKKIN
jgi:thiamine biosynthesis lipoprotein